MLPQKRRKAEDRTPVRQQNGQNSQSAPPRLRFWYHDALLSIACFAVCLTLGKTIGRVVGPLGGLFFLAIVGGAGYIYGRTAWREFTRDRGRV